MDPDPLQWLCDRVSDFQRSEPNDKERNFKGIPASVCWEIENCKELFGLGNDKEAISAVFEAGTGDNKSNSLFGSSGIASRTDAQPLQTYAQ